MIVFGVDTRESFEKAEEQFNDLVEMRDPGDRVPVILVGNRTDRLSQRSVKEAEARSLFRDWQEAHPMGRMSKVICVDYIECSAKQNEHISICFDLLTEALIAKEAGVDYVEAEDFLSAVPKVTWCSECSVQ